MLSSIGSKFVQIRFFPICFCCAKTFISSAAVEHLDFLNRLPDSSVFTPFEEKTMKASFKSLTEIPQLVALEEEPFASEAVSQIHFQL